MGTDKTIIGVLGGIAIGAVLGVVFAPDKGSNTRTKIIKKGNGITDDLREKLDNITNSLSEKYNSFKSQGEDFAINEKGKVRA
ncbi:YtxH domain-containing protein [Flavobacterium aquicola]|uniref:YtxH-like protein n=1 Tax=Flavobacterium aquicola TaxID=1682742 RepID=A0A3E0EWD0_9FLAO|nr:YtxH domain-containing protein [Flavobacterium aquicola]REH02031.1 YtxH-like protein [Flavobacterium aquicola]